jgi:TfoX/Sxy family transcriptional regulator of competence genes
VHSDAALRERQRDATRADAQLERGAVAGQTGEEVDNGIDDSRLGQLGVPLVVPLCHALAEVILGHGRTLSKRRRDGAYDPDVAYDEDLADRIRELLAGESDVTEKKMFGGLAFLISGNMAVGASGQGGILVRADPEQSDELVAKSNARLMEMRGRQMQGWLRVDSEDVGTKQELAKWVELGKAYARSLPAK